MMPMSLINVSILLNASKVLDDLREEVLEFEPCGNRDVDVWDAKRVAVDKKIRSVQALIAEALRGN